METVSKETEVYLCNPFPDRISEGIWERLRPSVERYRQQHPHEPWRFMVWIYHGKLIAGIQEG